MGQEFVNRTTVRRPDIHTKKVSSMDAENLVDMINYYSLPGVLQLLEIICQENDKPRAAAILGVASERLSGNNSYSG